MVTINLKSNFKEIAADIDLEKKSIARAAQRALNDAARKRKTGASKLLRARYPALKVKDTTPSP